MFESRLVIVHSGYRCSNDQGSASYCGSVTTSNFIERSRQLERMLFARQGLGMLSNKCIYKRGNLEGKRPDLLFYIRLPQNVCDGPQFGQQLVKGDNAYVLESTAEKFEGSTIVSPLSCGSCDKDAMH